MKYNLINCSKDYINSIIEYKCNNIFEYAIDIDQEEKNKIITYVINDINEEYENFKLIVVDGKVVGTVGIINYEDGKMLDEIFIEEGYRNFGIGTDIINNIIRNNERLYLWVYINNLRVIKLYKRLGFIIKEETNNRFLMMRG